VESELFIQRDTSALNHSSLRRNTTHVADGNHRRRT
jgi:hypothetical protein